MARIVVTNPIFPESEHHLREAGDVIANRHHAPWSRQELMQHLRDADALMAFMTDSIDRELVAAAPKLKVVACALKGYDNFDVEACTRAGVWVTVVPDLLTIPTAELAVALTLGLNRNLLAGDDRLRSGTFDGWRADLYGFGLHGAVVGIAGLGRVGMAIAERLGGFGATLLGFDTRHIPPANLAARGVMQVEWQELAQSDVIVLALPLSPDTLHLVDADALRGMKPGARLVNVGRGSVVDEAAVTEALENNRLGGYAADVFEMEDWARADRPRAVSPRLLALPDRTLFTPHLGSAVRETRIAIEQAAVDAIVAVLEGREPDNAVNRPVRRPSLPQSNSNP